MNQNTYSDPTKELRRALEISKLKNLLNDILAGRSQRSSFINEYINYINLVRSNSAKCQSESASVRNYACRYIICTLKEIIIKTFSSRAGKDIDILLYSRNRQVTVKTVRGKVTGDYIFFSINEELKQNHPDIKFEIYQSDDLNNRYEFLTAMDFMKALLFASKKYVQWLAVRDEVLSNLRNKDAKQVESFIHLFFSVRMILRSALSAIDFDKMLTHFNPKVILANDDCLHMKPLNRRDLMVMILQSARMVEYLEMCREVIFDEKDLRPDCYLSAGLTFTEIKTRYHAARRVITTGLPRYDILYNAPKIYKREEFFDYYKVDFHRKMILWSTQCHAMSELENKATVEAVLKAISELSSTILVIKQHPAEGKEYELFLRESIEKLAVDAIVVPRNADTYELLSICDLHITKASTTAMEAIALNKPVIILNLGKEEDVVEYVREEVARGVYKQEDLLPAIESLLLNDAELSKNRQRYIERYLYKIDGQATHRVVELLLESLKS